MDTQLFILIFTAMVGSVLLYCFNRSIFGSAKNKYLKFTYITAVFAAILAMHFFIENIILHMTLVGLVNFGLMVFVFRGLTFTKLFIAVLLISIIQVGDVFTYGMIFLIFPGALDAYPQINPDLIFAVGATISYLYFGIAVLIFHLFKITQYGNLSKKQGLLLISLPLTSYIAIATLMQFLQARQNTAFYMFLIPSLFFIVLLFFVMAFYRHMQQSKEQERNRAVLSTQLKHFEQHYETLDSSVQLIREHIHDWRNHLLAMNGLSKSGNFAELTDYISGLSGADKLKSVAITGNPAIDSVINALKIKSTHAGIRVDIKTHLIHEIEIITANLCVLISNAVDNAFEACEKIEGEDRFINMVIIADKLHVHFEISNSIRDIPKQSGGRFVTGKSNKSMHGIGLQSIERIVDRHNGHLKIDVKKGLFMLRCVLRNEKITN